MNRRRILFIILIGGICAQELDDTLDFNAFIKELFKPNSFKHENIKHIMDLQQICSQYHEIIHLHPHQKVSIALTDQLSTRIDITIKSENHQIFEMNTYDLYGNNKKFKALSINTNDPITYLSVYNSMNETNAVMIKMKCLHESSKTDEDKEKNFMEYVFSSYIIVCLLVMIIFDDSKSVKKKVIMISFIFFDIIYSSYMDAVRKFIYLVVKI